MNGSVNGKLFLKPNCDAYRLLKGILIAEEEMILWKFHIVLNQTS